MTAGAAPGHADRPNDEETGPARLHRSTTDRVLAGVCGGIAETYGADPIAVRLLAVVVGILSGIVPMLVVYLVAAVVIPEAPGGEVRTVSAARSRIEPGQGALILGVILIVAGGAALAREVFRIEWELMWPAALIALGGLIVLLAMRRERP